MQDNELYFFIPAFIALLDNYERETGVPETVTPQEERENWHFINLVVETPVMKEAYRFLKAKRKVSPDPDKFKKELHDMWFKLYRRTRGNR